MAVVVDQLVYPAGRHDALTFRVYSNTGLVADPTVTLASAGTDASEAVYSSGTFAARFAGDSSVTGLGSTISPLVFSVLPAGGWPPTAVNISVLRVTDNESGAESNDVAYDIPPSLATGKSIHYYPLDTDADYTPAGVVATIAGVSNYNQISVTRSGGNAGAYRGGTNFTKRGDQGTFDILDTRHRRRVRMHLTYANAFADNLIADPTLRELYWSDTDVDLIIQSPGIQQSLFDSTVDKFNTLGIPVNFGMLTVANLHPAEGDATDGVVSRWLNSATWESVAEEADEYWQIARGRMDNWFHCQMEAAFMAQALAVEVTGAGYDRADLVEAMSPYTDWIRTTGLRTIVRPFGVNEDWGLVEVLRAGAPGSIWCLENDGFSALQYRNSPTGWKLMLGADREFWSVCKQFMPQNAVQNQFHYEGGLRMYGVGIRNVPTKEHDLLPIYEITYLNEQNGAINIPHIGKTNWYQQTTLQPNIAGGTRQPSVNNANAVWFIGQAEDGLSVANPPGLDYGLATTADLNPWHRTTAVDAIDNTIPLDTLGRGLKTATTANSAQCWRIEPEINNAGGAFTLRFFCMFTEAPESGEMFAIAGQAQSNAHAWNLIWNGTTNNIELNVRDTVGQQTFTVASAPTLDTEMVILVGYNPAASATGKWRYGSTEYTPNIVKNVTNAAILLGGTHDLLNRSTSVWGNPGMILPYGKQVAFWRRADWTANEVTCLVDDEELPIGYTII